MRFINTLAVAALAATAAASSWTGNAGKLFPTSSSSLTLSGHPLTPTRSNSLRQMARDGAREVVVRPRYSIPRRFRP
jgi:hypothetical protein